MQLIQDIGGAVAIAAATSVWLKIWTTLASAGRVDSKVWPPPRQDLPHEYILWVNSP
jgi:hypothetical protein